jgi:uncharacterized protein
MSQLSMPVTSLDLDITKDCCLQCSYCFRGAKENKPLSYEVAQRSVDFLLEESGGADEISIALFGGEPLFEFNVLKRVVRYGERRAAYFGKRLSFGATTNSVLVNAGIIDFFRRHRIRFHTSIDGGRESHDAHRVFPNGKGSSAIVFKNIKKIMEYQTELTARWTLCNDTAHRLHDDFVFLHEEMGYNDIAMVAAPELPWTVEQLGVYESELRRVSDYYVDLCRRGEKVRIKHIDDALESIVRPRRRGHHCGAGRGCLAVAVNGDLFPCHRFSGGAEWQLGSIWDGIDHEKRRVFLELNTHTDTRADCENCSAVYMCGMPCIAVNWVANKNIYTPPPTACALNRLYVKEALRIHYILQREENKVFVERFYPREKGNGNARRRGSAAGPAPATVRIARV